MTERIDKCSVHYVLMQPVKLLGYPKVKDKIDALNSIRPYADLKDIEYIYPLVFEKDIELASTAAQIISEKYTKINIDRMSILLNFNPEVSVHLLGVASLNYSGYIREKALKPQG